MVRHSDAKSPVWVSFPVRGGTQGNVLRARLHGEVPTGARGARGERGARTGLVRRRDAAVRAKPIGRRILSWADAETALAALAGLERDLAQIHTAESEAIARAQAEADTRRVIPARMREALLGALERFSRKQLASGGDLTSVQVPQSRRLLFGRVGYRRSHAVLIRSVAAALRRLAASRGGRRFLRVSTDLNREALRGFLMKQASAVANGGTGDAGGRLRQRLRRAGVRLVRRDYWFYELNRETLGSWG